MISLSDCYVLLNLPTASALSNRTKTIANSNNPEWNETFTFRVHSNIKNILEILMYDEDPLMRDDQCGTILFDISNLTPGKKETKCFIINDKVARPCQEHIPKDLLYSDLVKRQQGAHNCDSKCLHEGHLAVLHQPQVMRKSHSDRAGPFCELNVEVDKLLKQRQAMQSIVLKLKGAYKEDFVISNPEEGSEFLKTLKYYINRDLETELNLSTDTALNQANCVTEAVGGDVPDTIETEPTSFPLKPLPNKHQLTLSLPLGQSKIDLELKTQDRSDEALDVRLDFDIPPEEKNFLQKRRKAVSQALQKVLNLTSAPDPSTVPVVAVVCSGGGSRALTSTYGTLKGLQKIQVLESVSYITGVSGATWALSSIYEDPNWSRNDIDKSIESLKNELSKTILSLFSKEQLQLYREKMNEREKQGYLVSLIDMWGLALEYLFRGKV
ncbi:hypothetical protein DNTS_028910 [Danionella cerebrum]|uniref:Phospholipase A2 n=1 Tax=Danionella cerebrum TaxID=2873325 RepID=A0A553N4W3_9TELE|nr:hypothetical protein DNTS_028910 [Danionella translucida]